MSTYNGEQIARELDETAAGQAYHGNALRAAKDFPCLDGTDRHMLDKWATGSNQSGDHWALQRIAVKLREYQPPTEGTEHDNDQKTHYQTGAHRRANRP